MRKTIVPILALLMVLVMVSAVHAAICTPQDCAWVYPCVYVDVVVLPECVEPGGIINVHGYVRNNMDCYDWFKITVSLAYWPFDVPTEVSVKHKWKRPTVIIPLGGRNYFDFSYEITIPREVPEGKYTITLHAAGRYSQTSGEDIATFYVGPCPSTP